MYDPYAEFTKYTLSNGLEVHFAHWDRPWIGIEIIVHSGAREDPVAMPGLAHFVEHTVNKNIPNRQFDPVKEFFEVCGGQAGFGSTSYLSTHYKFGVPTDLTTFREALDIFGSMLLQAKIQKDLEREGKVIMREFNQQYPFLERLEWGMGIRKELFKGHRLETYNRPLGRPEGFLSVTEADLQGFYDQHYTPANMSLVIIGGLSIDQVITELDRSPFGVKRDGQRSMIPQPLPCLPIPTQQLKTVKLSDHINFKVDQTEYRTTWAFPAHFSNEACEIFDRVLCKILFDEIREKRGLAYSVGTSYTEFQDVYEYEIWGRISPEATPYIDSLVRKCIEMVPARRDLFDRMLKSSKQRCLMIDLSGQSLAANSASSLALNHKIITMQEILDALHQVTHAQVVEAASFLSPERQYTLMICP